MKFKNSGEIFDFWDNNNPELDHDDLNVDIDVLSVLQRLNCVRDVTGQAAVGQSTRQSAIPASIHKVRYKDYLLTSRKFKEEQERSGACMTNPMCHPYPAVQCREYLLNCLKKYYKNKAVLKIFVSAV